MSDNDREHWTKILKTENEILRVTLRKALDETRSIIQARFDKEARYPAGGMYGTGYSACVSEIKLRQEELASSIQDDLVNNGIQL